MKNSRGQSSESSSKYLEPAPFSQPDSRHRLKPDFNRSIEIDIPIVSAGAYAFYTTFSPLPNFSTKAVANPVSTRTHTYYVDVSPRLTIKNVPMPLNALAMFSVISKFMGKTVLDWDQHIKGISDRGYNMVHFTPLQQRGSSNSPYSIYDQLTFDPAAFPNGEQDIARLVTKMENEYGLLGLTDVVLNHTANNSNWLEHHPESGYNLETAPWLEPAEVLDTALLKFGCDLESLGLPTTIVTVSDLTKIMESINSKVIATIKLWEYYVVDVEKDAKASVTSWRDGNSASRSGSSGTILDSVQGWDLKQKAAWLIDHAIVGNDRMGERFRRKILPEVAASMLTAQFGRFSKHPNENNAFDFIHAALNEVNSGFYREYDAEHAVIMDQLANRIKYMRMDEHGPKLGPVTKANPLIETYFTRLPFNETTKVHSPRSMSLANNGWVWAADAMKDNAGSSSRAFLRREMIIWGDCVKLRYGSGPADSPFLWQYMAKYARQMAKYFTAFRIDNCHSTPIHVAEYMLDQARKVRPNLAIFAELFSGSEATDYAFVQRLGISGLIREGMQAGDVAELSRLIHMHGGMPIGSFELDETANADQGHDPGTGMAQTTSSTEIIHKIRPSTVHALLCDCTHDNETPAQKRQARDALPNAALVSMCASSTGSVMGYDEIYPSLIDLVGETRLYTSPSSSGSADGKADEGGIGNIKKTLNRIHVLMGKEGYEETYVDHRDQYITVHRVHPQTRKGFFLIAHTAFPGSAEAKGVFDPVHLAGTKATSIGSWTLQVDSSQDAKKKAVEDKSFLQGLPARVREVHGVEVSNQRDGSVISLNGDFPPGSIAVFETSTPSAEHTDSIDKFVTSGARFAFKDLQLRELNLLLYRCDPEERDISDGKDGVYTIPNFGPLVYAGLQGWWSVLKDVIRDNDLGHPICQHLREGSWALDYCVSRLDRVSKVEGFDRLQAPTEWMRQRFDAVKKLPSFLTPRYFAMVIQTAYNAACDRVWEQMSEGVQNGPRFLKELSLVSVQMSGFMKSTSLYPRNNVPCLAAGLPHFAFDWARCWGRDVFISLRGLLLGTGRFSNSREHILAFGSVVKHGMIPNLLGSGKITRYNSRDSVWFFLQNIQDYTKMAPNGMLILKDAIKRRFLPYDDTWFPWDDERAYSKTSTIEDIIQEALQRHATGMSFREANAGPGIDSQMKDQGFNLEIHVDWNNGMIFGGNQYNCGTWMDKMGESEKAGSKGIPGTPRDGASVEITGLLYSTLIWVSDMFANGQYKYEGVKTSTGDFIKFKDWAAKIEANFERCYYVPLDTKDDIKYDVNSKIVNRRGIYKDLYRSGKEYEDYQLRPNFPIAMTVAPKLFDPEKALYALYMTDTILRKPTGMATLDPSDYGYRPNYINSEDSTDFRTSKGRNYHSGPEWLWPTGFFLRAMLKFDLMRRKTEDDRVEAYQQVTRRLHGCMKMIRETPWAGLTELTNENGSFCADSVSFLQ